MGRLNDENSYEPTGFDHRDYRLLGKMTASGYIRTVLYNASYRDKRILRQFDFGHRYAIVEVIRCKLEEVPRYVAYEDDDVREIVKWRLHLCK